MRENGGVVKLIGVQKKVLSLIKISHLDRTFRMYDTLSKASKTDPLTCFSCSTRPNPVVDTSLSLSGHKMSILRSSYENEIRILKNAIEQKEATSPLDSQIHKYFDYLRIEKNLSPQTLASYKFDFLKYRNFLIPWVSVMQLRYPKNM